MLIYCLDAFNSPDKSSSMSQAQEIKQAFTNMTEQAKQLRLEKDERFAAYQSKVNLEFARIQGERESSEHRWVRMEKGLIETQFASVAGEADEDDARSVGKEGSLSGSVSGTSFNKDESLMEDGDGDDDDDSQQTALNHIHNFYTRKEIVRRMRFKKSHSHRQSNLTKLDSLYREISTKTSVHGYVSSDVVSAHFDSKETLQFQ
ncbi:hypothetical protein HDV03_000363 [Kappamyces sp. JEL0829]|nr:hypothetical protein HDV03_000363 [Kappamyces sp. JEL0829]